MRKESKHDRYMQKAFDFANDGTCPRARTGAIIVKDDCIIGTGFNGAARGEAHCDDIGCDMEDGHCVRAAHAEENAIVNCARSNNSTIGAVMYCTHRPCHRCLRLIINAGITHVYYCSTYADKRVDAYMLRRSGHQVRLEQWVL